MEQVLKQVFAAGESWGNTPSVGQGKSVIVEYSSPNIAKPFHAGHLRSTIIGNFLKNLHKMLGFKTIAINYLGDWGKQYGKYSYPSFLLGFCFFFLFSFFLFSFFFLFLSFSFFLITY